jgi:hypothetical protein
MMVQSKKYTLRITKENFLKIVRDKHRLPAEGVWSGPFTIKKCEWFTGKIRNSSFELCDYRYQKLGINIKGEIIEGINGLQVATYINFKLRYLIFPALLILWFLLGFYFSDNVDAKIFLILAFLIIGTWNYFITYQIIKYFYLFFESLFEKEYLIINKE